MDFESGLDILKLAELLKPPEPVVETKNDDSCSGTNNPYSAPIQNKDNPSITKIKQPQNIEEFEEQQDIELLDSCLDGRKQPVFDIKYRQAVSAEDVFLQMGAKTPATASCEDMIVTVELPGEKFTAMELAVTASNIKLSGFIYKLDLTLPQPVNPDISNASWNQNEEKLVLTLKMNREFDFVNF